ncbi:MAG: 23S rRNA (guanine2445-N2)-methyltransferase / 23S rRNA (guanine2069-N7)-methyltransferase [Candidatus Latescibacterota bacterium]
MSDLWTLFATTPRGLEALLAEEIETLGGQEIKTMRSGVSFMGTRETAYRICLWSRVAGRLLLKLAEFPAETPEELYAGVQNIDWSAHLMAEGTLAVDCATVQSEISHTHFASLKVKDAIVDQFRDQMDIRPNVELERPDIRVNVYLFRNKATISLDLSGESLHKRGYRKDGGEAPIKEHLAAALLLQSRWPRDAQAGGTLMDPMCGSGTFLIEGAMMAGDIAPSLSRPYFGFENWLQHDAFLWRDLVTNAHERREAGLKTLPPIVGSDVDPTAISLTKENIERAGLLDVIEVEHKSLKQIRPIEGEIGLLIANPPYGERLGEDDNARRIYSQIGNILRDHFAGWRAAIFTGRPDWAPAIKLKPRRSYDFFNGTIPCKLMIYKLGSGERKEGQFEKPKYYDR